MEKCKDPNVGYIVNAIITNIGQYPAIIGDLIDDKICIYPLLSNMLFNLVYINFIFK